MIRLDIVIRLGVVIGLGIVIEVGFFVLTWMAYSREVLNGLGQA